MVLIASLLLAAAVEPSFVGPTPRELARALANYTGQHVSPTNIRRLSCQGFGEDEPTEAVCKWQQRIGRNWKHYSTYVAIDGRGWHLIDEPNPKS